MKTKNKLTLIAAVIAFASFSFTTLLKKEIQIKKSSVTWKAYKITGASHEGTVNLKEGTLEFDGETLVGGNFVVDMTSIGATDVSGGMKSKLDGHLKSNDFFGTEKHPTASLKMTHVKGNGKEYKVKADLTIKGKTNPISFIMKADKNQATAKLKVDRTKFGVEYGSASIFDGLKDKAINDEFDLNVTLKY